MSEMIGWFFIALVGATMASVLAIVGGCLVMLLIAIWKGLATMIKG